MNRVPPNPDSALRDAMLKGNIVFVAGTGVSMSATFDPATRSPHPQASWAGLLKHGLETAESMRQLPKDKAALYLKLLTEDPTTQNFISAATTITTALGGVQSGIFKDWIKKTIGMIRPINRDIIEALHSLRKANNLLATTNYDDVLLAHSSSLQPVTWMDGDEIIGAQRNRELDKIIFLHGYWKRPETVILDGRSYEQIARHEEYRADLTAFWRTTTWVYVGCGVGGLNDPDFGLLLERHGERARDASHWDFCLVHEKDQVSFQARFDELRLNIVAASYGADHNALPSYLRSLLPAPAPAPLSASPAPAPVAPASISIPTPPDFYAEHDYIGRHTFIGRAAQLETLSDWAKPSDPTSVLLFEAIGGNGKSMLTWEWATKRAPGLRAGKEAWAGRFWYSFYEKGAIMRAFCQHALAYMTRQPLVTFEKWRMADLRNDLLAQLHQRPWLLVLDGLERVLVAYHRIDASEVRDEEVNRPTDKILDRDPCNAIRDEDSDLIRALAAAAPSKILVSSRLIPRVLLNQAGIPLPGVKPLVLPGLDEPDAEELLRTCGVKGTSADIRYYLTNYCANHPLVIGVLAGLINSPGPHRCNFDAWAADPAYGAKLNLASLDLIQSRKHILRAALEALEPASRQFLSTLALLSYAVDYPTVAAFNPHLPPEPEEVRKPVPPEKGRNWDSMTELLKAVSRKQYKKNLAELKAYDQEMQAWRESAAVREAPKKLADTMQDLEQRGLLQYDGLTQRYDLHPVVRGVAAGAMQDEDKERYGLRVVDYFASQPHNPYEQAKTMEDVENGLHVVRTLLKLGHYQRAADAFVDLSGALHLNLEGHVEVLSLLRPFFPAGWDTLPKDVNASAASLLANSAAIALNSCGEHQKSFGAFGAALRVDLETDNWVKANTSLRNIAAHLFNQNLLAEARRMNALALGLATVREDGYDIFMSRLFLFFYQSRLGQWQEAEETWRLLDSIGPDVSEAEYRQCVAKEFFARFQFWQDSLQEEHLTAAATLAERNRNRITLRRIHSLRGAWRLRQGEWELAAASFDLAVTLARERRLVDEDSETGLALAKYHLGQLSGGDARAEAERLVQLRRPADYTLALLWLAIGDRDRAKHHALAAYRWGWADGEPHVNRYGLTKATELLQQMNVPIPTLPAYDASKELPFPWEVDLRTAMEKLRAQKQAKDGSKTESDGTD